MYKPIPFLYISKNFIYTNVEINSTLQLISNGHRAFSSVNLAENKLIHYIAAHTKP